MTASDLAYCIHKRGLLRALGYDRPHGVYWLRVVSLAWLAGYKLAYVDTGRFRLAAREWGPFAFQATITL